MVCKIGRFALRYLPFCKLKRAVLQCQTARFKSDMPCCCHGVRLRRHTHYIYVHGPSGGLWHRELCLRANGACRLLSHLAKCSGVVTAVGRIVHFSLVLGFCVLKKLYLCNAITAWLIPMAVAWLFQSVVVRNCIQYVRGLLIVPLCPRFQAGAAGKLRKCNHGRGLIVSARKDRHEEVRS